MKKDIDTQFLCKDCERYNLCQYYEYREKILERLSEYRPSQKIPKNRVTEILDKVYDSEIEGYFFTVESRTGKVDML